MIFRRTTALAALLALVFPTCVSPALAADQGPSVLRDTETEQFLERIAAPMAQSAGLAPGALHFVVLNDPEINAFVAGGQTIYVNSGLLLAADDVGEVEGVIAHELGHIEAGDAVRGDGPARDSGHIMLLSLLVGAAAMAAGAGSAGMAAMMAGQQGGMSHYLAYSRQVEGSADASAVRHLNDAHYSGRGMISFFTKLRHEEYRLSSSYEATNPYMQTHPMAADRQQMLEADLSKSPWWNAPVDAGDQAAFLRIKAKLFGFVKDETTTLRTYQGTDQPSRYARAYAWYRSGYPDRAEAEVEALRAADPANAFYAELQGQILVAAGHPRDALPALREAVRRSNDAPMIAALLGQALVETEDSSNLPEAEHVLKLSVARDRRDPEAWRTLGMAYSALGDEPRASLATAESYAADGQMDLARINAERAMGGLATGTPDWIRAQDIEMASNGGLEHVASAR